MSAPLKVMLVGEGKNELGSWVHDAPYRAARNVRGREIPRELGVLETLLRKVAPDGWVVADAKTWMSLVKLKPRPQGDGDARNLAAVIQQAKEQKCDVVVFSRDRDGAKNRAREDAIEALIADPAKHPVRVVGAVAVETLEAWVLAFTGDPKCESYTDPVKALCDRAKIEPKDTAAMVALLEDGSADLKTAITHSPSLARWVESAERVFPPA